MAAQIEKNFIPRERRVSVKLPAIIHIKNGKTAVAAEIQNLSVGGALLYIPPPLPSDELSLDEIVSVEIHFNTRELLDAKVVPAPEDPNTQKLNEAEKSIVRWTQAEDRGVKFGIQFKKMGDGKKQFLEELIKYFHQLEKAGVSFS